MSALMELGVGVGIATYGALLTGVGYQLRITWANNKASRETLAQLIAAKDRQLDWNEQTSRGFHQLTEDVEQLEDVVVRHSNRLRDDGRRLTALERRLDAHDRFHEDLARRQLPEIYRRTGEQI